MYRKDANVWDVDNNRECNLKIGGIDGNTVEFWMKKSSFATTATGREVIFDNHTIDADSSDTGYGRLTLEMTGTASGSPFLLTYMSGTSGFSAEVIGSSITNSSVADDTWHHYAFVMKNNGSSIEVSVYVDGECDSTVVTGSSINYVSGTLNATIGALATAPSGTTTPGLGWGKLHASIDEFRFWKKARTSKKVQRYWFDQVGAGTNTDLANTDLGVYFKFNEGITQTASVDSTVLDYSGRISNGEWVGYDSTYSRNVGSAILESSASLIEFRDPIIYSFHPDVHSFNLDMKSKGREHDDINANSLMSHIPAWMWQENETDSDEKDKNALWNLLQIMGSYFDEAAVLINDLPKLKHARYFASGSNISPFAKKSLESYGFVVPDLFLDASLLEQFEDRNDELKFETSLRDVKNIIYQNIYNNLTHIYKTKGTLKSFRNLFHCFGLGDNALKFNIYANEAEYKLEDNLQYVSKTRNYVNFNEISNADASIYQYKIDSDATSYIAGSEADDLAFTLETNIVLPNRVSIGEYSTVKHGYEGKVANMYPLMLESSLFGMHTAKSTENDLDWETNDHANFQVYSVKDDIYSSDAYFRLTCSAGGQIPNLTSSYFENVYDDQLWTFSVTIEPEKYPLTNQVAGTDTGDYVVKFYGVNHIADYKAQSFLVSGTISNAMGKKIISNNKRVYVGAHRTNFTGPLLTRSDVKVESCKAWMTSVSTGTIDKHNIKIDNYGADHATRNAYLYQTGPEGVYVPEAKTLALMWNFTTLSGSDASGQFSVEDESAGSETDNRYGWFSDVVSRRHTASGSFFERSSKNVVEALYRGTYQAQVPEVLIDSNLTRILTQDDEFFNRNTRPVEYHMSVEKNLFQDISEDMLNMFGSVTWFNKTIGDPVNFYRGEYKELKKAADLYFEKVDNDYDFDKYVEYFKFIDYAMSRYIMKLIPASMATFRDGISTVIENFVLDRNKFHNKYPIIKDVRPKEIVGQLLGVNELLYDWEHGHDPGEFFSPFSTKSTAFNGTNNQSLITIADSDSLSFGADGTTGNEPAFSISAWINMTDASTFSIFCKGGSTVREYDFFTGGSDNLYWRIYDSAHTVYIAVTTFGAFGALTSLEGSWAHVVATYDGSRASSGMKLYINGSAVATADNSAGSYTAMHNTSQPAGIGRFNGVLTTSIAEGFIDDVAVFDKELSTSDVTALYNNGYVFDLKDNLYSSKDSLVSWWRMGENKTGTSPNYTIVDEIGSNNAVMSNFQDTATSKIVDKHAPSAPPNFIKCLWWNERALRREAMISSGDQIVDNHRQRIHDAIINETNAAAPTLYDDAASQTYEGATYVTRRLAKPYKLKGTNEPDIHGGANFYENKKVGFWDAIRKRPAPEGSDHGALISIDPPSSELESFKSCDDDLQLNQGKKKYNFSAGFSIDGQAEFIEVYKGDMILPFSLYSSSLPDNTAMNLLSSFMPGLAVTNHHHDTYGPFHDVPMQGPFTEKFVGGRPYRHVMTNFTPDNTSPDNIDERLEGWKIESDSSVLDLVNPDSLKSVYFREEYAKRPVNIKNIKQLTGSAITDDQATDAHAVTRIGNYSNTYEVVMTTGRAENNRYLAESEGELPTTYTESGIIPDVFDFELPRRDLTGSNKAIIVNRFSAPGDPATMAEGMLDVASGEYSVYNALTFRNLSVRTPLNLLLSDHSRQFGYFSDAFNSSSYVLAGETYPGTSGSVNERFYYTNAGYLDATASFHKVNRNPRTQPFLTGSSEIAFEVHKVTAFNGLSDADSYHVNIGPSWDRTGINDKVTISTWICPMTIKHADGNGVPRIITFGDDKIILGLDADGVHDKGPMRLYFTSNHSTQGIWYSGFVIPEPDPDGNDHPWVPINGAEKYGPTRWTHVAVTYDGTDVENNPKFYINGEYVTTTEDTSPAGTRATLDGNNAIIGGQTDLGDRMFSGSIAQVSIWNEPLTSTEVKEIYLGSTNYNAAAGPGNLLEHSAYEKLIAWYNDNEATSTTLVEVINDYSGTFSNANMLSGNDDSFLGVPILTGTMNYGEYNHKKYDNFFIQHAIPQTDLQYAWIKAGVTNNYTGNALYDYEQKDFARSDYASSDITFVSASDFGSYYWTPAGSSTGRWFGTSRPSAEGNVSMVDFIPVDFVGLNTNINEPIEESTNTLGHTSLIATDTGDAPLTFTVNYVSDFISNASNANTDNSPPVQPSTQTPGVATVLNSILLHRDGPWAGANWKLYKKDNHPIIRYQKNNNVLGTSLERTIYDFQWDHEKKAKVNKSLVFEEIINWTEPCVTSKYKPLRYTIPANNKDGSVSALQSHGNIRNHFTDHSQDFTNIFTTAYGKIASVIGWDLDDLIPPKTGHGSIRPVTYSPYMAFKTYIDQEVGAGKAQVVYAETIYPQGQYTYLSGTRKRLNFVNDFWREDRHNREKLDTNNSFGSSIHESSIWKMDARLDFKTSAEGIPFNGAIDGAGNEDDGVGELQNAYSLFHWGSGSSVISAGANYNRRIKLITDNASLALRSLTPGLYDYRTPIGTNDLPVFSDLTKANLPMVLAGAVGDTLWEVDNSGAFKPFYDSYDEFIEEPFRMMKEGSIIPEYRISERMEDYFKLTTFQPRYGKNTQENAYEFFSLTSEDNPDLKIEIKNGLLSLTGSITGLRVKDFLTRYCFSDFHKHFNMVKDDYSSEQEYGKPETVPTHRLTCNATMKFLPYDGFYPSERTQQLSAIFSSSLTVEGKDGVVVGPVLQGNEGSLRTLMQPYFAPGVLFNSIKSGIAVDYPFFTYSNINVGNDRVGNIIETTTGFEIAPSGSTIWGNAISGTFFGRKNIDDLLMPNKWPIVDAEVDSDLALDSTASVNYAGVHQKHTLAMSNFLAESMGTFIGHGRYSYIPAGGTWYDGEKVTVPKTGEYAMNVVLRNSQNVTTEAEFEQAKIDMQAKSLASVGNNCENADGEATHLRSGWPFITSSLQISTPAVVMYDRATAGTNIDPWVYGSSFGPPVDCGLFGSASCSSSGDYYMTATLSVAPNVGNAGSSFDPFTPAYYNGYATCRITASLVQGVYELEEVLSELGYAYDRLNTWLYPTVPYDVQVDGINHTNANHLSPTICQLEATQTTAYKNAMQLSASLYLGDESMDNIIYEKTEIKDGFTNVERRLIIRPRFECPVLDFSQVDPATPFIEGTVARGMWHQYGAIPEADQGILLETGLPDDTHPEFDLGALLRINNKNHMWNANIGRLSDKTKFSEAIIAIPYKYNTTTEELQLYAANSEVFTTLINHLIPKQGATDKDNRLFFDAHTPIRPFEAIKNVILEKDNNTGPEKVNMFNAPETKAMYNMIKLMRDYVFPPHLDMVHNPDFKNSPFVMYGFEFSIDVTQKDLQNIWQNVEPNFAERTFKPPMVASTDIKFPQKIQSANLNKFTGAGTFYEDDPFIANQTRWAVFKVKKRAKNNFNAVVGNDPSVPIQYNAASDSLTSGFTRKDLGAAVNHFTYSYNWPHDFFSLVELAKIDSITTFNPIYGTSELENFEKEDSE